MIHHPKIKKADSIVSHRFADHRKAAQNQKATTYHHKCQQTTEENLKNMPGSDDKIGKHLTKLELFLREDTQKAKLDNATTGSGGGVSYQAKLMGIPSDASATMDADAPSPVPLGLNYYQERAADFCRRNPGMDPPDYYLNYGDKYANRFASLDQTDLSPQGLLWRDRTLNALQQAIEDLRTKDPAGFAELERDPEAFMEFAYGTHPDAYIDSGLFDLSAQDIAVIAATPDLSDVLSQGGIDQTLITLGKLDANDLVDIVRATAVQTLYDIPYPVAREVERIIDRFRHHTDWSRLPMFPEIPNLIS
jgi:hypothetical protein